MYIYIYVYTYVCMYSAEGPCTIQPEDSSMELIGPPPSGISGDIAIPRQPVFWLPFCKGPGGPRPGCMEKDTFPRLLAQLAIHPQGLPGICFGIALVCWGLPFQQWTARSILPLWSQMMQKGYG